MMDGWEDDRRSAGEQGSRSGETQEAAGTVRAELSKREEVEEGQGRDEGRKTSMRELPVFSMRLGLVLPCGCGC